MAQGFKMRKFKITHKIGYCSYFVRGVEKTESNSSQSAQQQDYGNSQDSGILWTFFFHLECGQTVEKSPVKSSSLGISKIQPDGALSSLS